MSYSGTVFSINQNPKNWEHGYLFEKQNSTGTTYVFIDPTGKFLWLEDSPSQNIKTIDGVWKRNPINKSLNFYSEDIDQARYLGNPLTLVEDGLFKQDQKTPVFNLTSESTADLMLPQIIDQLNTPAKYREFFSLYEINNREQKFSWEIPTSLENEIQKVLDEIKNNNKTAQTWSNKEYEKSKGQRSDWSKNYPQTWNFSIKTFSTIQSDSAKLRAMCKWIEENIDYDLEFTRANNNDHSPEIIFTNKKGLCLDYAILLNVFCESQKIPCFNIAGYPIDDIDGKMTSRRDSYHAWNYVKIQSEWYAVDPTWYKTMLSHDHFLIPIGAYQYQHLPDNNVKLANSFAPKNKKELLRCPVVKQNDMNIIYVGSKEYVTEAIGKNLEFELYAEKDATLNLHIDSLPHGHHSLTMSFCIGCYHDIPSMYEYYKGEKHSEIKLKKGINHIQIPLVSDIAEYTLRNNNFEIAFLAYPKDAKASALEKLTSFDDSLWCVAQAYNLLGQWAEGKTVNFDIPANLMNHPNWELIQHDFHNQELEYSIQTIKGKKYAIFEFSRYKIGGKYPVIKMAIDDEKKIIAPPLIALD